MKPFHSFFMNLSSAFMKLENTICSGGSYQTFVWTSIMQYFYPHEVMLLHVVLALYRFCFGGPRDLGWLDFEGDEEGGSNPVGI